MWFITSQIRGDGDSLRQQSPEFPLVNLSISTASFYKRCRWQWPTDIRLMRVECSCGSEAPLVLVSLVLEILDSYLKVLCLLSIQQALTSRFSYSTLDQRSLVKSATRSYHLNTIDLLCFANSPERFMLFWRDSSLWHISWMWYYPSHIGKWTSSLSSFVQKRSYFSILTFLFAQIAMLILGIFWLSRQNWSIGCFRTIIGEHFCLPN